MEDKQLRDVVKSIVDNIFSEKEETDRQRMTEEAITKSTSTINDLTEALSTQKSAFSEIETKYNEVLASVEEKDSKITAIEEAKKIIEDELISTKAELDTLKTQHQELVTASDLSGKELSELKEVFAEIEKTKVAAERYIVLEQAGVAYKDKEKQLAKIKEMTEEAFISYKDELLEIKEALTNNSAAAVEGDATPTGVVLANVSTPNSAEVLLNNELKTQEDLTEKYSKLGKAMAAALTKGKDKE